MEEELEVDLPQHSIWVVLLLLLLLELEWEEDVRREVEEEELEEEVPPRTRSSLETPRYSESEREAVSKEARC